MGDEGEVTVQDNKMAFLNDQDDLWVRYRNQHIVEVNNSLNQELNLLAAEGRRMVGSGRSSDNMSP